MKYKVSIVELSGGKPNCDMYSLHWVLCPPDFTLFVLLQNLQNIGVCGAQRETQTYNQETLTWCGFVLLHQMYSCNIWAFQMSIWFVVDVIRYYQVYHINTELDMIECNIKETFVNVFTLMKSMCSHLPVQFKLLINNLVTCLDTLYLGFKTMLKRICVNITYVSDVSHGLFG